mgnify:FL=1
MIKNICFWLKNSRLFSLPMTLLSWLVIFVYSLKLDGNVLNGGLALVGISFAHLATNLFDDYVDYKNLPENSQKCKCAYIKDGSATINDVLKVVIVYLVIASGIGVVLFLRCGLPVIILAMIGGIIALIYAKLSQRGLSELAVGTAFGPLLFEGVYFVMTGRFSWTVFVMSIAVVMFTIGLMYVHTLLDFEGDMCAHKMTLACRFGDKNIALKGVFVVYGLGYLFTFVLAIMLKNYYLLFTFVLIPIVFKIYKSLQSYTCGGEEKEFYFRLLQARNLMVCYSLLITLFLLF